MPTKHLNIPLPESLFKAMKLYCTKNNLTQKEFVEKTLVSELRGYGNEDVEEILDTDYERPPV